MSDLISRQAAIERLREFANDDLASTEKAIGADYCVDLIRTMPSAQPEIIRCRNCKFASGDSRICMQFGHSPIGELDFCAWAERRTDERSD